MMKMNKLFKKATSLILALLMTVSIMVVVPISTSADTVATSDWLTANFDGNQTYTVNNASDLLAFKAALASKDFDGETVKLTQNVDMAGVTWTCATDTFKGTFDGCGYSIQNLSSSATANLQGVLFGTLEGGTVKDLCIVGGTINGKNATGTISAQALNATIDNVYLKNTITWTSNDGGALVGRSTGAITIRNSVVASTLTNNTNVTSGYGSCVGFVGRYYTTVSITDCAFLGSSVGTSTRVSKSAFIGTNNNSTSVTLTNCLNMTLSTLGASDRNNGVVTITSENFAEKFDALKNTWTRTGEVEMMPKTVVEMINPADKFIPANLYYQRATTLNEDGTIDVRFVATIDKLDYAEVGFNITVTRTANGVSDTSAKVPFVTTTVYDSINALSETVTAEELGGQYIVAIVITGINCADYAHSIAVEAFVKDTTQSEATVTASGTVTLAQIFSE